MGLGSGAEYVTCALKLSRLGLWRYMGVFCGFPSFVRLTGEGVRSMTRRFEAHGGHHIELCVARFWKTLHKVFLGLIT